MKQRIIRYSGLVLFGAVTLVTALSITVIATQWDGVLYFLFGTA